MFPFSQNLLLYVNSLPFQAPSSLLEALESHLANLEGRKVGSPSATTPTG